jgi:PAS domain-containing protein
MRTIKKSKNLNTFEKNSEEVQCDECWDSIVLVVNTVREPVVVIDNEFRVLVANDSFYKLFQLDRDTTEGKIIYTLSHSQWDIPALHTLLEVILPKNIFFIDYEVVHDFAFIGNKTLVFNARQMHIQTFTEKISKMYIFLAIEDMTSIMEIAHTLTLHIRKLESESASRTMALEKHIRNLEKEIRVRAQ